MPTTVGIMSMQRILNYGSTLQAIALRRMVEDLSSDLAVSFVDFRPGPTLIEVPGGVPATRAGRIVAKVREYSRVDARMTDKLRFLNHKRTYARRYFPEAGIPLRPSGSPELDVQVIGSDEVFNCVQGNTNVGFSRDLFGFGSPAKKVVSYAASFGNTTLEKVEAAGIATVIKSDLERFSALSVRDRNSADIIEHLTGSRPEIHLDPCLAMDLGRIAPAAAGQGPARPGPSSGRLPGKYILVYGYSGRLTGPENDIVRRYARSVGSSIICLGGVQGCCDRFLDCSPFDVPTYFREAEAVITDTFHGTIFAVTQQRPFATIVRSSVGQGYGNQQKLDDLLGRIGLSGQRVTSLSTIDQLASALAHRIDYGAVNQVLATERERSRDYLRRAIL